jgi:DNA-binding response OmpR family regulator
MQTGNYILIVEDDFDIREALTQILEEEGYAVRGAANGREALDVATADSPPSLIVLDLMMPVMNGWQFRAEQLKNARLAAVPVLVISADPHLQSKAASLGVAGLLKKPISLDELLAAVKNHCR